MISFCATRLKSSGRRAENLIDGEDSLRFRHAASRAGLPLELSGVIPALCEIGGDAHSAEAPPVLLERQLPNTMPGIGHVEHGASRIEPKRRRRDMFTDRSLDLRPMRAAV